MNLDQSIAIISTSILLATAIIYLFQWREMKKSASLQEKTAILQVFNSILQILQQENVRSARRNLIQNSNPTFEQWTPEQIHDAEIACGTFDAVAIILRKTNIDYKMVASEWTDTIIRCWEHAKPMINAYRKRSGSNYWDDYEWLYNNTVKLSDSVTQSVGKHRLSW